MSKPIQIATTCYRQDELEFQSLVVLLDDGRIFERQAKDTIQGGYHWEEVEGPWTK